MAMHKALKFITQITAILAFVMFANTGFASDRHDAWEKDKGGDKWADFRMVQTERHKMIAGIMKITKDLVEIVNNINHHPSAADKANLKTMSRKLDEMMAQDDKISRKMAHKWKQKWNK